MKTRNQAGLTLVELLVIVAVIIALLLVNPHCGQTHSIKGGQMTQSLSNMKQLHLATQIMALDGVTTANSSLGWPGDRGGTFSQWATTLVRSNYLTTNDLCKLLSAPGRTVSSEAIPSTNNGGILVYAVKEESGGETVFFHFRKFHQYALRGHAA